MSDAQSKPSSGSASAKPPSVEPEFHPEPFKARLTVVDGLYHQVANEEPISMATGFSSMLDTKEQPWIRRSSVGELWSELPIGWIESCSLLVLANEEGKSMTVNPTDEGRQATKARVIQLGIHLTQETVTEFATVQPGQSLRFEPTFLKLLRMRCMCGTARYTLVLIPG